MIHNRKNHQLTMSMAFVLAILVLLSACSPNPEPANDQSLMEIAVGYCPTMQPYAQALAESHQRVTPIQYDNSAAALEALKARQVQAAIIGRVAWQNELTEDFRLVRLADGLTLIAQQPGVIRFEDLPKIRVLTSESEAATQDLIPVRINVLYYDDFDRMLADMDGSMAVLLRWSQVTLTDNLLIPVDGAGNKIAGFRSPHFYYLAAMEEPLALLLSTLPVE